VTGTYRLLLLPLVLAAGCTTTRPPEVFPDLADEGTPSESLCTVRESRHCFVGSVDDIYITQYDVNPIAPGTYRQLQLPPGRHTLSVVYREQRNLETITAGPRFITLDAQAGRTYELRPNVHGADAWFADTLRMANWRPTLVDAKTNEQVAIAPTSR
jgi:hypothetical protein